MDELSEAPEVQEPTALVKKRDKRIARHTERINDLLENFPALTAAQCTYFAALIENCGNIGLALKAADRARTTLFWWRGQIASSVKAGSRKSNNVEIFRAAEEFCKPLILEALEDEARRRAVRGVKKARVWKGQVLKDENGRVMYEYDYDTTLLLALLKKADPSGYGTSRQEVVRTNIEETKPPEVDLRSFSPDDLKKMLATLQAEVETRKVPDADKQQHNPAPAE